MLGQIRVSYISDMQCKVGFILANLQTKKLEVGTPKMADRVTRNVTVTDTVRHSRGWKDRVRGKRASKTRSVDFNEIPGKRNTAQRKRRTPKGVGGRDRIESGEGGREPLMPPPAPLPQLGSLKARYPVLKDPFSL